MVSVFSLSDTSFSRLISRSSHVDANGIITFIFMAK